jgi:hypothetical protein
MKRYTLSWIDATKHVPEHPGRTAKRSLEWDVTYQVWSNRKAMAKTIRMQQKRGPRRDEWVPCVPLSDVEGY